MYNYSKILVLILDFTFNIHKIMLQLLVKFIAKPSEDSMFQSKVLESEWLTSKKVTTISSSHYKISSWRIIDLAVKYTPYWLKKYPCLTILPTTLNHTTEFPWTGYANSSLNVLSNLTMHILCNLCTPLYQFILSTT